MTPKKLVTRTPSPTIRQTLADAPYTFVRRLDADTIVLAYGDTYERWSVGSIGSSIIEIRYGRKWYRYAGQVRP